MRVIWAVVAILLTVAATSNASAQSVVTRDPRAYTETLADAMGVSGMAPLRSLYVQIAPGGTINATVEAALLSYERALPTTSAAIAKVEEDVTLSDTYRQIYLYHYWGQTYWVHTRLDFVRISANEWALSYLAFGSEWSALASSTTAGFRSTNRN